jgi:CHAT domain-containing protein/Tfp pilus assembly protein PilF
MAVGIGAWAQVQPGAVVEKVAKGSEGEKAGVQPGDVLQRWSRGDIKGEIESPFDLTAIEVEQAPQGVVSVEGSRGQEKLVWKFGQSVWGARTRPDMAQNLLASYLQGEELAKADKPDEIAQHWRQLAAEARQSSASPHWLAAWLLYHGAEQLLNGHHWKEGDALYQEAVEQAPPGTPLIHMLSRWGDSYLRRGDMDHAEKCYGQLLNESRKQGAQTLTVAVALNSLGNLASERDDLAKSQEYYNQALAIRQRLAPESLVVAGSLSNLGILETQRCHFPNAEEDYLEAMAIKEKLAPDSLTLANTLNNLGVVADEHGDMQKAEEYYALSIAIRRKLDPNGTDISLSLSNLGIVDTSRGDLAKAEERIRQGLAIDQKLTPGGLQIGIDFQNLAVIAEDRGDEEQAEEYYRKALEIEEKQNPDSLGVARSIQGLGAAALIRHDLEKSKQYYDEALAIAKKVSPDNLDIAFILIDLGRVAWESDDLTGAEERYRQASEIALREAPQSLLASRCLHNLATVAQRRNDLAKAEELEHRALALREKLAPGSTVHAESLATFGAIMRGKQQPEVAAKYYEQGLAALESQIAHLGRGEETRSGFRAQHADDYKDYMDLLIADKKPEQAFYVLERLRARALLETLAAARVDIRKGVDSALVGRERSLQELLNAKSERRMRALGEKNSDEQVALFDKEIKQLLLEYKEVEEQIRTSSPGYAALTQPQPLDARAVQQQLLDNDTLLLEYSLGEERSYVFAVTPDSLNAYELPRRSEVEDTARNVYRLLAIRSNPAKGQTEAPQPAQVAAAEKEYARAVAELSRMVLGPVAERLQAKRLMIVSDGALQYIPFSALPVPAASPSNTTVPLVTSHEIVNLPSATVLAVLRREEANRTRRLRTVAVLADPVFTSSDERVLHASVKIPPGSNAPAQTQPLTAATTGDPESALGLTRDLDRSAKEIGVAGNAMFSRLPFTRREADAIYSAAGRNDGLEALDFDASKATALSSQLKDYRILHFATHGLLNNDHPELSGLVLSLVDKQGQSQDGFLRMMDIYNMELNADLVVLSACQTALGKEIGEEGLVGLTRGFMYAGAPRVVASLWKVDDEATAALMKKFYEGMLREHQTPAQALRAAQQWMRTQKTWQSPYYWAGFVLQGEWK